MRKLLLPVGAALLLMVGVSAYAQGAAGTWFYSTVANVSQALFQGVVSITGNLGVTGTTTLNNLNVTGSANLPAAGITCSSLPLYTGQVASNASCVNTIAAGTVTPANMQAAPANSYLSNTTGGSASPTWTALAACGGTLGYVSGTGLVCAAAGQVPATATNDNAAAGKIGEVLTATQTGLNPSSGIVFQAQAIALTAGDWDCSGAVTNVGYATITGLLSGIGPTSAVVPAFPAQAYLTGGASEGGTLAIPTIRISLAAAATYYVNGEIVYTGTGTVSTYYLCRRMR
jgi:hypothetical protein